MRVAKFPQVYTITPRQMVVLTRIHRHWASLEGMTLAACEVLPYCRIEGVSGQSCTFSLEPFASFGMLNCEREIPLPDLLDNLQQSWSHLQKVAMYPCDAFEKMDPLTPCLYVKLRGDRGGVQLVLPVDYIQAIAPLLNTAPLNALDRADMCKKKLEDKAVNLEKIVFNAEAVLGTCTAALADIKPGMILKMNKRKDND